MQNNFYYLLFYIQLFYILLFILFIHFIFVNKIKFYLRERKNGRREKQGWVIKGEQRWRDKRISIGVSQIAKRKWRNTQKSVSSRRRDVGGKTETGEETKSRDFRHGWFSLSLSLSLLCILGESF